MRAVYNVVEIVAKIACTRISKLYPTKINDNYYSPFLSDDDEKKKVIMTNCSNDGMQCKSSTAELAMNYAKNTETMFNTSHIKIAMDMEIVDDGETGHLLLPGT